MDMKWLYEVKIRHWRKKIKSHLFIIQWKRHLCAIKTKWSEVKFPQSCPTLCNPTDYTVHGIFQVRILELSLSLLQGIFPTQGLNPGLLNCRRILYQLSHKENPGVLEWVAYPFSSVSSDRGIELGFLALHAFFTNKAFREIPPNISQFLQQTFLFFFFLIFYFILFYFICSEFCHTLEWNSHGFTCVPHPDPHLPPPSPPAPPRFTQCTRSECLSHASNLGWWFVSP